MTLKKRGFASAPFRWIFAMIAGAVVVTFFYMIISGQGGNVELEVQTELASAVGTIIAGLDGQNARVIELPDPVRLEFDCSTRSLRVNGISRPFVGDAVVIIENNFNGNRITIQSLELSGPFPYGKVAYISRSGLDESGITDAVENLAGDCRQHHLERFIAVADAHIERMQHSILQNSNCNLLYDAAHGEFAAMNGPGDHPGIENLNRRAIKASCPALY